MWRRPGRPPSDWSCYDCRGESGGWRSQGACLSADTRPSRTARNARSRSPAEPGPFRSGRRARRPTTRALAAWTKRGTATARWPSRPTGRPWFGGGHCLRTGPFGLARGQTLANRRASGAVRHRRRRAGGGGVPGGERFRAGVASYGSCERSAAAAVWPARAGHAARGVTRPRLCSVER